MKRGSFLILPVFLVTEVGCATAPKRVLSLAEAHFDEDWTYQIDLTRGGTAYRIRAKGREIEKSEQGLLVRKTDGSTVAVVESGEIRKIEGEKRVGSYALPGMGIGAASLALVGGLVGGLGGGSCEGSSDLGDCKAMSEGLTPVAILVGIGGGA